MTEHQNKIAMLKRTGWVCTDGLWTWTYNPTDHSKPWPSPSENNRNLTLDNAYAHMRFMCDVCFIPVSMEDYDE